MDRLATTRLAPPTGGIKDAPEVDFRCPNPQNDRISLAMATKLRRECEKEESRIRSENEYLMLKLQVHGSIDERRRHHKNLVPVEEPKPFEEQASNIVARRREARRVAEANETLMFSMATLQPTVRNDKIKESVQRHNELVKRISKFKPTPRYAGEELLNPKAIRERRNSITQKQQLSLRSGGGADVLARSAEQLDDGSEAAASCSGQKLPKIEWRDVSPHDVRVFRRQTDRAVRSVFLRNEAEVIGEAQAAPKCSNVTGRRLTWTELGLQAARVPAPPSPRK